MRPFMKRRSLWVSLVIAVVVISAGAFHDATLNSPDVKEFQAIREEWDGVVEEFHEVMRTAKSPAEKDKAKADNAKLKEHLADRCVGLAKKYPDTAGGIAALFLAATRVSDTEVGRKASDTLSGQIASAELDKIAQAIDNSGGSANQVGREFARPVLKRVRQNPNHQKAGRLLAFVCVISNRDSEQEPPAIFIEAAGIIAERYADSPDIVNFCELLGRGFGSPAWATRFEKHLRTILSKNQHRKVRCAASFALASVVQSSAESRQPEAEELYQEFVEKFDGSEQYSYAEIEKQFNEYAKRELEELKVRGLGKPAPEIEGVDLDDRPMKLSEYRGKAVLLNFWGTWCFPCMKLIPHERELVTRFQGKPFAIVGVNCDTDETVARDAVTEHTVTWRSFKNRQADKPAISDAWKVVGYPMLYLIDQKGIVRKRWIGSPPYEELDRAIDELVDPTGASAKIGNITDITNVPKPPRDSLKNKRPAGNDGEFQTGFIDKLYRGSDGYAAKYVVFIPAGYDGKQTFPVLLYLHGAGLVGTDGRKQIGGALGDAIRKQENPFPFVTVFPQSHEGSWQADSKDGHRALAILDEVGKDFKVDSNRVYLTGVSMGGEGTWSLAASYPNRWAAIVPICGGGDRQTAAKIKDIPCWCFQGDADRGVVDQSREMIRAMQNAGGRPLYHEYPGVGHNCWDITYAKPELYEWILQQKLK